MIEIKKGTQAKEDRALNWYCLLGPQETVPQDGYKYLTYRSACMIATRIGPWMKIYRVTPEMMFEWGEAKIKEKLHRELDYVPWSSCSLRKG